MLTTLSVVSVVFPPANLWFAVPLAVPEPETISVTLCPVAASENAGSVSPLDIVTDCTLPFDTVIVGVSVLPRL